MSAAADMFAQRSAVGGEILIQEPSGREFSVLLVDVDLADDLAPEEKEVVDMATDSGWREFLGLHEVSNEGFEFLEELLATTQVDVVLVIDAPGGGPWVHQSEGLAKCCGGHGALPGDTWRVGAGAM